MGKIFIIITLMFILGGFILPSAAQDIGGGQVTIPLEKFLQMVNTKNNENKPAPVPSPPVQILFGIASLNVTGNKTSILVECNLPFQVFYGGWNEISLLNEQVAIKKVTVDGEDVPVYSKNGKHTIIYKGYGKHKLDLTYLVTIEKKGNSETVKLPLPPSSASNISITLAKTEVNIQVNPSMGGTTLEKDGNSIYNASLPKAEEVQLSWNSVSLPQVGSQTQTTLKPKIYAQVYDLLSVSMGAVRVTSLVDLSVLRGQEDTFYIQVPSDVEVLEVKNEKLQGWSLEETKNGKIVVITMVNKIEGTQQITLIYEKPLKNITSVWSAPFLKVIGAEQEKGFIACEAKTSLEMKSAEEQEITRVDIKELPSSLVSLASTPIILAYRYYKHPFTLNIETVKYEEVPVLAATIDTAQAVTFVNEDGISLTKIIYQMRNNMMQFLNIKLPEGAEILNAFVGGSPVKPVKPNDEKEKNVVLIPLKKSDSTGNTVLNSFAVEITYKYKGSEFSFLGKRKDILPGCNIQISEYYWTIYLPVEDRIVGFSGNMKMGDGITQRNNSNYNEFVAQKVAPSQISEAEGTLNREEADKKKDVMIQNFTGSSLAGEDGKVSGILPVELYIPQSGQVFTFKKLLVEKDSSPLVGATYISEGFLKIICWFVLIISLILIIKSKQADYSKKSLICIGTFLIVSFILGRLLLIRELLSFAFLGIFLGLIYLIITSNGVITFIQNLKNFHIKGKEKSTPEDLEEVKP